MSAIHGSAPNFVFTGPNHLVQFYEGETFLYGAVADFLAHGLAAGEPILIIATKEHHDGFLSALNSKGFDAPNVRFAEARATLAMSMDGGLPNAARFRSSVGGLLAECLDGRASVRAYGEMVDLLWRDGNPEAALRLEELWNELARDYAFTLLCAYPMGNFDREADGHAFEEVCRGHGHVLPAESFPIGGDEVTQRREISRLQQRAAALEAEIDHRKKLEQALRDALAERQQAQEANAFLLEATAILNLSLDYAARLKEAAAVAVPRLADDCTLYLAESGSEPPPEVRDVLRTGEPYAAENRIVVPMKVGARVFGAITFAANGRDLRAELPLAVEFARRAAIAIENARLYQLAETANRTKDEFLATLSHELRTPLTAILGWARMLVLGNLDPDTMRTAYETIERSARTQTALIDDLLDLSRVVTGKLRLQTELIDLMSVIDDSMQTMRPAAEAKRIDMSVQGTTERVVINGDPTRLQQIIWNLLSNAVKFSVPDGSVRIKVQRAGDFAQIVVRDEGQGIPPAFLPHVFEPFRQADGAHTRTHGGLGLGLAIVKYLTEMHGGSATASSAGTGQGATFTVTLPLASYPERNAPHPAFGHVGRVGLRPA